MDNLKARRSELLKKLANDEKKTLKLANIIASPISAYAFTHSTETVREEALERIFNF